MLDYLIDLFVAFFLWFFSNVSVVLGLIAVIVQRIVGVLVDGDSTAVEHTHWVSCTSETQVVLVGVHIITNRREHRRFSS